MGYRTNPAAGLSVDIATFYNLYDHLRSGGGSATPFFAAGPPRLVIPITTTDEGSAKAYGVEVAADWEVLPWWRLKAQYSLLEVDADDDLVKGNNSPRHQASLRSMMDLGGGWEFDLWPRYVDNLSDLDIDAYVSLDARLAWRPSEHVELSVVGQNPLDSRREEFVPASLPLTPTQNERGVYAKATLTF